MFSNVSSSIVLLNKSCDLAKTTLLIHNANITLKNGLSSGQTSVSERAIELYKVVLRRLPEDDARVATMHRQMAIAYWSCYSVLRYPPDLEGALEHSAIVISTSPDNKVSYDDRFRYAQALAYNYSLSMNFSDLDEAIRQIRRAIDVLKTNGTDVPAEAIALL
ncbi:hypothetical protein FRC07_009636, partial [Ceratobasidium sp. 392]